MCSFNSTKIFASKPRLPLCHLITVYTSLQPDQNEVNQQINSKHTIASAELRSWKGKLNKERQNETFPLVIIVE